MKLTVLGNYGSFPGPDGACSGYLLEEEGLHILLDCGNGVLSRLQRYCTIEDLDAVIVSHLHLDHVADLFVLRYGLLTKRELGQHIGQLSVHLPATPEAVLQVLDGRGEFSINLIQDGALVQRGTMTISFTRMEHSAESYAIAVTAGGKKLVYSGDTLFNPGLIDAAQGADLFLCEATAVRAAYPPEAFPHMTARQAAEAARQAGVQNLLLTHLWYEDPKEEYVAEARVVFPNVALAEEFVSYEV